MYDWANSVYSLVITSAIFPTYYKSQTPEMVTFLNMEFVNTALISYVGAFGFLIISLLMPIFSGIADHYGRKRFFLRLFTTLGSMSCMALFFFGYYAGLDTSHGLFWTIFFYWFALICFWLSLVFYNSYLPQIAPPEEHDKLSAKGFSFGYVGSVILLGSILFLFMNDYMPIEVAFILTGLWWFGFTQWPLKVLPKGRNKYLTDTKILSKGFRELGYVWSRIKLTKRLKRFTQAFFVYSMGIQTVMMVAVYFAGKEIDWPTKDEEEMGLIVSILLIQLIAVPGAYVMSYLSKKIGNIKALIVVNAFWAVLCASAIFINTPTEYFVMAAVVGFVMGGIQSLSRSTYSKFLPEIKDTTTYFSFYDVSEKVGLCIGLFVFAYLEGIGTMNDAVSNSALSGMRLSVVSLLVFFLAGIVLLLRVPKEEVILPKEEQR